MAFFLSFKVFGTGKFSLIRESGTFFTLFKFWQVSHLSVQVTLFTLFKVFGTGKFLLISESGSRRHLSPSGNMFTCCCLAHRDHDHHHQDHDQDQDHHHDDHDHVNDDNDHDDECKL